MRRTKIIATIGPACSDTTTLQELIAAGVDVCRFNFSHAAYDQTAQILQEITTLRQAGHPITTILDTKGPEIRSGQTVTPRHYTTGEQFKIVTDPKQIDTDKTVLCDYPYFIEDVDKQQEVIIDSGLLRAVVVDKHADAVIVEAQNEATIGSKRHINLPGVDLRLPALTDKDKQDILFGIEQQMNFVAVSFIRSAENVQEVRNFLDTNGGEQMHIIAKIENQQGVDNIEQITQLSDGVMIARGDLGIEVEITSLPGIQQQIIETGIRYGKPVIYATELLKSMVTNVFPTRSEVSDVYHAIASGCDLAMLSEETATGQHPIETVQMLDAIVKRAELEQPRPHKDFLCKVADPYRRDKKYSLMAAHQLADNLGAQGIIVFTQSGFFARMASAYKTNVPIHAFTPNQSTIHYLQLFSGVHPWYLDSEGDSTRDDERFAIDTLRQQEIVQTGDKIIIAYDEDNTDQKIAKIKIQNL